MSEILETLQARIAQIDKKLSDIEDEKRELTSLREHYTRVIQFEDRASKYASAGATNLPVLVPSQHARTISERIVKSKSHAQDAVINLLKDAPNREMFYRDILSGLKNVNAAIPAALSTLVAKQKVERLPVSGRDRREGLTIYRLIRL